MAGEERSAFAIAAGGTGGHIYPALATAQALKDLDPDLDIRFMCGCGEVELSIYHREGIEPVVLPIGRAGSGLFGKLSTMKQVWAARSEAQMALSNFRPFGLLGMGGYVAFGPVWAAHRLKIPIILHEQNSVPGRAHRMSAKWSHVLACAYPEVLGCAPGVNTMLVGNPIRGGFDTADGEQGRSFFDVSPVCRCLLVSGGSQGAGGINRLIRENLDSLDRWSAEKDISLSIIWSCGSREFESLQEQLNARSLTALKIRLFEFIEKMDLAYAAADLVVGRAGAGTVAEVTAAGKPAVFVPFPAAIHDHQRSNAKSVVRRGGALMVDEQETSTEEFFQIITDLMADWVRLSQMAEKSRACGRPQAAEHLASLILSLP